MKTSQRLWLLLFSLFLSAGCNSPNESTPDHYLTGTYVLSDLTVYTSARANVDTVMHFIDPVGGTDSITVVPNALVYSDTTRYTTQDADPVYGTAVLGADGTADLTGKLPTNIGTPCDPLVVLILFGSDGTWTVNDTTGSFSLDLVMDAADINGHFQFDQISGLLTLDYLITDSLDTMGVQFIDYLGSPVPVHKICLPVTTSRRRVMNLIREP